MNCSHFELVVSAVARKQLLDVMAREAALTHTRICVRCAHRLAEERAMSEGVRSVVTEIAIEEAPQQVEAALLAAFREHAAQTTSPTVVAMPIRTARRHIWKLAAIAAVILLLISGVAILRAVSSETGDPYESTVTPPAPFPGVEPVPRNQVVSEARVPPRRLGRAPRRSSRSSLREVEVATEFFPLLGAADVSSLENGQIVRVELPASALLAVGLPVGAAVAGEVVEADVVLGHDGLARAIRFVR